MLIQKFAAGKKVVLLLVALLVIDSVSAQFQILKKEGLRSGIDGLEIAPNSNYFLGWYEYTGTCVIWDIQSGQEIQRFKDVKSARFASNGEHIYLLTKGGDVKLVDLPGRTIRQLSKNPIKVGDYQKYHFYPEQAALIIENKLYDVNSGYVGALTYDGDKNRQQYNVRKNILTVPDHVGKRISIVQLPDGQKKIVDLPFRPWIVRVAGSGNNMMVLGGDTLQIISTVDGRLLGQRKMSGINTAFKLIEMDFTGENLIYTTMRADGFEALVCENAISGKQIWRRDFLEELPSGEYRTFRNFQLSANGKTLLAANGSQGVYELFDVATGKTIKEINSSKKDLIDRIGKIAANELAIYYDGYQLRLNLETGSIGEKIKNDDYSKRRLADGDYSVVPFEETRKSVDKKFEFVTRPMTVNQEVTCQNGGGVGHTLTVRSTQTKRAVFTRSCKWISFGSANTQHVIAIQEIPAVDRINFYNYTTAQKLYTIPFTIRMKGGHRPMIYSPDDAYLTIQHDEGLLIFDIKNKRSYSANLGSSPIEAVAGFSPDNKYALITVSKKLKFLDLATGQYNEMLTIENIQPKFGANTVSFTPDGRHLFYIDGNDEHMLQVYDVAKKREIASVHAFLKTNDWAVVSPSGLFEANEGAQNNVYYATANSIAPLATVFEQFFTPKLLPRILSGETFKVPVVNDLKAIPTVSLNYTEGTRNLIVENEFDRVVTTGNSAGVITVKADCPSDKVTEIRLYHNGKLTGTTRNLIVEDEMGQKSLTRSFNVTLSPGDNVFSAVAVNSQRSESKQVFINAKYKPENKSEPENIKSKASRLHVIVVGINKYKNSKYNLNYASADATAFKTAIESGAANIFSAVNTYFITDDQATKEGIKNAFDKVKESATADDLFVFYYAGHGVLDNKAEYYLIPHDVTQLYGNDQMLTQLGISASFIQLYSKDIKAKKQLFILDACQSAGAFSNAAAIRGVAEEKAIAQLARATGTHWLTASGSDQFATEFSQLGHGVFTYCLLEAMKGYADNGDKKLTVKEIDAYLQNIVPEITKKYKGTAQYPASSGTGNDFPVIVVK